MESWGLLIGTALLSIAIKECVPLWLGLLVSKRIKYSGFTVTIALKKKSQAFVRFPEVLPVPAPTPHLCLQGLQNVSRGSGGNPVPGHASQTPVALLASPTVGPAHQVFPIYF